MTTETFERPHIDFPEVFIGIVSPVGANIKTTIQSLKDEMEGKGYDVFHIKVSSIIKDFADTYGYAGLRDSDRYDRINSYIDGGNFFRRHLGNDILSIMAIASIARNRLSHAKTQEKTEDHQVFSKNAYIIDQLKTPEEIRILREVYGQAFFQVSVYSARNIRVDNLSISKAHDAKRGDRNPYRGGAEDLIGRDEDETENPNGQKVGKIFQLADVVINADRMSDKDSIERQVRRFVELLFGSNGYSPNRREYGMFLAFSAASRSLDLSRQVGAAIFRSTGEIATLGTNEVPKATGGTYWDDDSLDAREYKVGADSNDRRKAELLNEVIEIVTDPESLTAEQKKSLQRSQFMDALEYGRIVHAEMSAISDAARLGIPLSDATLYCTTFPCHMCSKHIVAAGIKKVVFLEPYPKSLTADLHSDSVRIEGSARGAYEEYPAVDYVPFFGITPRRYRELFARGKRKSQGEYEPYRNGQARPIISLIGPWYAERESELIGLSQKAIAELPNPLTKDSDVS